MPETTSFDPTVLSVAQLLSLYATVLDELRKREVTRSSNNPLSDYAEGLFCKAFGWTRNKNSATGHDAVDAEGLRYEIKARRLTPQNPSRQLSAIRSIDACHFDFLAAVLVDRDFSIVRAAIVPHSVVHKEATFVPHTNSSKFMLRDHVWQWDGVRDVTDVLQLAAAE